MISLKSYVGFRYETKKIGWVLGIIASSENRNFALHWLLSEEGARFMEQCYAMNEYDDFDGIDRNFLLRNMATLRPRKDAPVRYFQLEIDEVYRKTVSELRAIHRCILERITADEVGIDPARWENWLSGKGFLSDEQLEAICLAADFMERDKVVDSYRRIAKLSGSYAMYEALPSKKGAEVRLGRI